MSRGYESRPRRSREAPTGALEWPSIEPGGNLIRFVALGLLVATLAIAAPAPAAAPQRPGPGPAHIQLVRFGGLHLGGSSFRPRPTLRRPSSILGRRSPGRSRGILRRIGRALAFAAILHFLFAGSHGLGFLLFLVLIVGLVVMVARRRRRAYDPRY